MKVAMVSLSLSREGGGLFESLRGTTRHLKEDQQEDITMIAVADRSTQADLNAWAPVTAQAFPLLGPRSLGFAPRMVQALSAGNYDLLHTHGLWTYPSAAVWEWHRQTKRPYLVSPHGMLDPWAVQNSRWKKKVAAALFETGHLKHAACLRALCPGEAEAIRAYGQTNPICVIPNGVDLAAPDDNEKPAGAKSKTLLFLGRLHPKKGLVTLLEAWAALGKSDWALVIAGWDQAGHEEELNERARQLAINWVDAGLDDIALLEPGTVAFLGPRFAQEKVECFRRCDGFILPSVSEGLPMVILEAWSFGKPVVMTAQCNLPEGFAREAAVATSPTALDLAESLRCFFGMSSTELNEMGRRGRQLVAEKFTWAHIAAELHSVHEWLLGGKSKPACVL